jgi:hypothetical protein
VVGAIRFWLIPDNTDDPYKELKGALLRHLSSHVLRSVDELLPVQQQQEDATSQLPGFLPYSPGLWFSSCDSHFFIRGITDSRTKFTLAVRALPVALANVVLYESATDDDPYKKLKEAVLEHLSGVLLTMDIPLQAEE